MKGRPNIPKEVQSRKKVMVVGLTYKKPRLSVKNCNLRSSINIQ